MPSDLLELTRQIHQAPILGAGLAESMIGSYRKGQEIEQMRREMEAQQQLRQLFAQGQQPTLGQIGAVNPELALKYPTFGYDLEYKKSQIGKNLADIEAKNFEAHKNRVTAQANMLMPIIDARDMAIQRGESPEVANKKAMAEIGAKAPVLESMGIGFLPGFSITDNVTPDDIKAVFNQFGVKSQLQQMQELQNQETAKLQGQLNVPPRMTPDQYWGNVHMWNGYPIRQPSLLGSGMGGGAGGAGMGGGAGGGLPQPQPTTIESGTSLDAVLSALADPNTSRQDKVNMLMALQNLKTDGGADGGAPKLYTAEEITAMELEKQKKAEENKVKVAEQAAMKKSLDQYMTLPSPAKINEIIEASEAGDIDAAIDRLGKVFGISTEKGKASAKLRTIVQQFAKLSPFAPGSQSDKEYQARIDEIGDLSSATPVENRLGQFQQFINSYKKSLADRAEFTPQQLLSLAQSGHFTKEEAAQIASRLFANEGAAQ